jgi:hypothetical protein
MIAKVDQILRQNGIVFEELMYARPASAEIPVYWIAFYGVFVGCVCPPASKLVDWLVHKTPPDDRLGAPF